MIVRKKTYRRNSKVSKAEMHRPTLKTSQATYIKGERAELKKAGVTRQDQRV